MSARPFTYSLKKRQILRNHPDETGVYKVPKYREQILDAYIFKSLDDVRSVAQEWVTVYNHESPHEALAGLSPVLWKNGQHADIKSNAFPDHFPTSDNSSIELAEKYSIFEPY